MKGEGGASSLGGLLLGGGKKRKGEEKKGERIHACVWSFVFVIFVVDIGWMDLGSMQAGGWCCRRLYGYGWGNGPRRERGCGWVWVCLCVSVLCVSIHEVGRVCCILGAFDLVSLIANFSLGNGCVGAGRVGLVGWEGIQWDGRDGLVAVVVGCLDGHSRPAPGCKVPYVQDRTGLI